MLVKKIIVFTFVIYLSSFQLITAGEDSIPLENLELDLFFSFDRMISSDENRVNEPKYLVQQRVRQSPYALEAPTYSNYTDNPFFHFASFVGLQMDYHFSDNFYFHTDLIAEHRGYSFGFLSNDVVQLFPQFFIGGNDTLIVFDQSIQLEAKLGDLIHHSVNQGLTFSNDDYQGGALWLKWRNVFLRYLVLADASANAGLNVDELWSYKLGWENYLSKSNGTISFSAFIDQLMIVDLADDPVHHYGISLELFFKQWRLFWESSIRNPNGLSTMADGASRGERLAFLIGSNRKWEWENNNEVHINFSLRRYARYFNNNYSGEGRSSFRNTNEVFNQNYSGKQLYPLKNTYRPFLKWPVFTQFQDLEIWSASLQLSFRKHLWNDFYVNGEMEALYLNTEETGSFIYHFYHCALSYNGWKGFRLEAYATNKVMNLDVGFQSFYQSNMPFIGYRCIRWFGEGPDLTKRQRLN